MCSTGISRENIAISVLLIVRIVQYIVHDLGLISLAPPVITGRLDRVLDRNRCSYVWMRLIVEYLKIFELVIKDRIRFSFYDELRQWVGFSS